MLVTKSVKRTLGIALGISLLVPLLNQASAGELSREEKMVVNLRVGHGSTGFYVLESVRLSKEIESDIRKALFQMREVDKSYAKSRGRPDDRFLERATVKLTQCQDRARALTTELEDTNLILKEVIKDTLVGGTQKE